MNETTKSRVLLGIRAFLSLAFIAAGVAKLAGAEMLVQQFELLGVGQWLRYVTGVIEIGSAIVLWLPGLAVYGAALLGCTMVGALIAHVTMLGMETSPGAFVLGTLAAITFWANRAQLRG